MRKLTAMASAFLAGSALLLVGCGSSVGLRATGVTDTSNPPVTGTSLDSTTTTDCGTSDMLDGALKAASAQSVAKISSAEAAAEAAKGFHPLADITPASTDLVMLDQGPFPTPRLEWRIIYHNVVDPSDDVAHGKPLTVFVMIPADGSGSVPDEIEEGC